MMVGFHRKGYFLILLTTYIWTSSGQSTSSQPPGFYAGYLNRYTKEDQCVYSFVVPKKDRDQCPGLKATVEEMKIQLDELQQKQRQMDAIIDVLNENKQSWQKIGELESQVGQLEREKSSLVADKSRLQSEKDSSEDRRTQLDISLQDAKSQLQEINQRYQEMSNNNTQMTQEFKRNQKELEDLRNNNVKLTDELKTLQRAKNCSSINKHLPSCAAIKRWGYTKSGYSMIDPDGEGGVEPFIVYCDMETDKSTGITVVEHDLEKGTLVEGCETAGCFVQSINYKGVSIPQMTKLIDSSIQCEQSIKYDCYDSKLLKHGTAWWLSRNGRKENYWGGGLPGSNKCACGMTNSCADPDEACNCDADSESWLSDEGLLTDKSALPVTQLNFGDVSSEAGEKGKSTLGELRCKWDINMPVPSCDKLRDAGVTQSGDYMVDQDGTGPIQPQIKTCDLGSPISPRNPNSNLPNGITSIDNPFAVRPSSSSPSSSSNNLQNQLMNFTIPQMGNLKPLPRLPNKNMYQFTSCGQEFGRFGPTGPMCNFTYQFTNVRISVEDGMQIWTVPKTGRYRMVVKAPSGQQFQQSVAGRGAVVRGEFKVRRGVQLKMVVGQKGTRNKAKPFYGGSGGTFVYQFENWLMIPLLVAGGGGSASGRTTAAKQSITDANLELNGKDSSKQGPGFGKGGTDGHGGERGNKMSGPNTSGGGAGVREDGTSSGDMRWGIPLPAKALDSNGKGTNAPCIGGYYVDSTGDVFDGGFGGGGSGAHYAAGGGGGYSGGGGGPDSGYGGGGGSYVNRQRGSSTRIEATNEGDGHIHIEWLGPAPELDIEPITPSANS